MRRFVPLAVVLLGAVPAATGCGSGGSNDAGVYAGAYPVVSAPPSPVPTENQWAPTGAALGRLPAYPGKGSKVIGVTVDKVVGLSYAKLAPPWHDKGLGNDTGGQDYDKRKPVYTWLGGVYSGPLLAKYAPAVAAAGKNRLRAAAELSARPLSFSEEDKLTLFAGTPLKVSGHDAWLAGFHLHIAEPYNSVTDRTVVEIAVDTGRKTPSLLQIVIANPVYGKLLPDITTVVKSLKVVR